MIQDELTNLRRLGREEFLAALGRVGPGRCVVAMDPEHPHRVKYAVISGDDFYRLEVTPKTERLAQAERTAKFEADQRLKDRASRRSDRSSDSVI
jgi:hypothetical protein